MTGRAQQLLNFPRRSVGANASFTEDISGGFFHRLSLLVNGTHTIPAAGTPNESGAAAWLGDVRITQNSTTQFSVQGRELFAICRYLNGTNPTVLTAGGAGSPGFQSQIDLDFNAYMPGAGFDGSGKNRFGLRLDTRPLTALASNTTAIAATVEAAAEHFGGAPGPNFLMPRWHSDQVEAFTQSTQKNIRRTFDNPGVLLGVAISAIDKGATDAQDIRSNGIVAKVKLKLLPASGSAEEIIDDTWSRLRSLTAKQFRIPESQVLNGFVLHRFIDANAPQANYGLQLEAGDTLQIELDNATAPDPIHLPQYAPAALDHIVVTWLYFEGSRAGSASRPQRGRNAVASSAPLRTAGGRRRRIG